MRTVLLVDADILLWRASSAVQTNIDWGGGVFSSGADFARARDYFDAEVRELALKLRAQKVLLAFSDAKRNWRKELWSDYKANRSGKARPVVFWQLRSHAEDRYDHRWYPGLEGDDVLGIFATAPHDAKESRIVVSSDKDLQTVPCRLYNPNKPERGVRVIQQHEADEYHMIQSLTGDPTDGYKGCPGVGPKKADRVLTVGLSWAQKWEAIVRCYKEHGLPESVALMNARVARILRHGEYDLETHRVTLWEPPTSPPSAIQAPARSGPPAPAETPEPAKAASTSSRRSSSRASPSTSRTARRSTGTGTGRKASRSRGTSTQH